MAWTHTHTHTHTHSFPNPLYPSWPYNLFDASYSNPYTNPLLGDNTSDKSPSCIIGFPITNCQRLPQSLFKDTIPQDINKDYIQYHNNDSSSIDTLTINQSTLCICSDEMNYDCHNSDLGYLYPGQTLTTFLHSTNQYNYVQSYINTAA